MIYIFKLFLMGLFLVVYTFGEMTKTELALFMIITSYLIDEGFKK